MAIVIESRHLGEVVVLRPDTFPDNRGRFTVMYQKEFFRDLGLPAEFPQENCSVSRKDVVRGLHFQWDPQMGKLMYITHGRAFLVAVDIRKKSPTLGQWFGTEVSGEDRRMVWAPPGFARGLCALSDEVVLHYKVSSLYNPKCEGGIRWNDPDIGIRWPVTDPILSEKDAVAQTFSEWLATPESDIFQ